MSTPNSNIHFTLVGSGFHDSFVDALKTKAEQYTYTSVSAFTEYKAAPEGHDVQVIVLNEHDEELAKATTLTTLLDQPIILVFFAPSKDILEALHKAAESVISIPSIELDAGVPIIIHRRPRDGVISLTAGFNITTEFLTPNIVSPHDDEMSGKAAGNAEPIPDISTPAPRILTLEEKLAMAFAQSVDVIQLTVEYLLELLHGDGVQHRSDNGLTPPPGTSYYKTTEMALAYNSSAGSPSQFTQSTDQRYSYIARLQVHAHCANANPTDPNFAGNGGIVYVVAVLNGQMSRNSTYSARNLYPNSGDTREMYWFVDYVSYAVSPGGSSSLVGVAREPQAGQTSGLVTTYNFAFGHNLNLWTDGGSRMFPFPAKYQESFSLTQFKETVQSELQGKYNVLIYYDNYYDKSLGNVPYKGGWENVFNGNTIKPFPADNVPLHGLFAWTTSSLTSQAIDVVGSFNRIGYLKNYKGHHLSVGGPMNGSSKYNLDLSTWN